MKNSIFGLKSINKIYEKIGSIKLTKREANRLLRLATKHDELARFYYGLYLLLDLKREKDALDWIKK